MGEVSGICFEILPSMSGITWLQCIVTVSTGKTIYSGSLHIQLLNKVIVTELV
jgi:hypothetical protein